MQVKEPAPRVPVANADLRYSQPQSADWKSQRKDNRAVRSLTEQTAKAQKDSQNGEYSFGRARKNKIVDVLAIEVTAQPGGNGASAVLNLILEEDDTQTEHRQGARCYQETRPGF
jgi:hypothetical protein